MSIEPVSTHRAPDQASWPPVWKLWANPILRRYCRSRLRPRGLGVWILVTLLISGFIFFVVRGTSLHRGNMEVVDAERIALIPLLVFQGILLFLLGTGQVAGAMTGEADEGVLDYQRLAPMSPLAKVLGYLFGLPIREYVLVLVTAPFTLWCLWRGQVPVGIALQLYLAFFTAGILYHLTGLVAGTVVKNKRWAFLVSMAVVFLLYTVMPQLANFGLVYFKYLTIYPVFEDAQSYMVSRTAGAALQAARNLLPSASFFNLDFPQIVFTLISQGALILTMIIMLWRRWRRAESHLLGKAWATGLFGWIQLVLLGNALPLIEPGYLFPSRSFRQMAWRFQTEDWSPEPWEGVAMVFAYGAVTLALLWIMTLMITPNAERRLRGWRRARKFGQSRLSPLSDPATGFPWVLAMVVMGAGGWFVFAKAVLEAHWFPGQMLRPESMAAFAIVMVTSGLGFHALLEGKGGRAAGLGVIFIGVVPIMVGTVVAIISDRFAAPAIWLFGISPASAPLLASSLAAPLTDTPPDVYRAVPRSFWFWQGIGLLVTLRLITGLARTSSTTKRKAGDESPAGATGETKEGPSGVTNPSASTFPGADG